MAPLKLFMKIRKLVSGILSIVLSVFVLFQSALAGVANTMSANGEAGGSAGFFGLAALFGFTGVRVMVIYISGHSGAQLMQYLQLLR